MDNAEPFFNVRPGI